MQHKVESRCRRTFLELLTAVLLVGDNSLKCAITYKECVVADCLIVVDLLERQALAIAMAVATVTFDDTRSEMIVAQSQMAVTPFAVYSNESFGSTLTELRPEHILVVIVLIGVSHLVRPPSAPDDDVVVAFKIDGIVEESVVRLVFRRDISLNFP